MPNSRKRALAGLRSICRNAEGETRLKLSREGDGKPCLPTSVILGLDPRIHEFNGLWMVGSSPTMTKREVVDLCQQSGG